MEFQMDYAWMTHNLYMTSLSMSGDKNVFHATLDKNYSKIFVSGTNGPITFGS